ncbi:phosphatidate cytidylyltransferase [Alphaproteobacteria bacterium]|nr:phosphatidate cytidylyltransferase [Alphaproteobacteria bacterium]
MVNNFSSRLISSFFLIVLFILLYIFNFSHLIFLVFFSFVYYELFKNKIINLLWIFVLFLAYFLFLNFTNFVNIFILSYINFLLLIFIILFFLSFSNMKVFFKKILLNIFIFKCFIFFTLLYINNFEIFFIVILLTSINDIVAYILGSYFKGPKIIPSISPNKTWSGTILSYISSVFLLLFFFNFNYIYCITLPVTFFIGDIFFSNFKRILNIKDYGNLIKGHGGFLDRFDSSFLSLSFTFLFFLYI